MWSILYYNQGISHTYNQMTWWIETRRHKDTETLSMHKGDRQIDYLEKFKAKTNSFNFINEVKAITCKFNYEGISRY